MKVLMKKLSFIFLTSLILLVTINYEQQCYLNSIFYPVRLPVALKEKAYTLVSTFKNQEMKGLALSYIFGINKELSPHLKNLHQSLNLKHLFSPSGLHLGAVLGWVLWLRKKGWPKAKLILWIGILILGLLSLKLPGYYPLKRTLGFQFLCLSLDFFSPKYIPKISNLSLFLLTFLVDFIFGSFNSSPLSFTYSFLFWGIILSEKNFTRRIFYLGLGQILVAYFAHYTVNPLSFITNALLSPIFSLLFPFIFFALFTPFTFISESLLNFFFHLLEQSSRLISFFPSFEVNEFFIITLLFFIFYQIVLVPKKVFFLLIFISISIPEMEFLKGEKTFTHAYIKGKKKGHPKMARKSNKDI